MTQICVIQESEESTFGENFTAKRAVPALFLSTWGLIHQTKPKTSNFDPLKYEFDLSTHARDKRGVKIVTDCGTPCRIVMEM